MTHVFWRILQDEGRKWEDVYLTSGDMIVMMGVLERFPRGFKLAEYLYFWDTTLRGKYRAKAVRLPDGRAWSVHEGWYERKREIRPEVQMEMEAARQFIEDRKQVRKMKADYARKAKPRPIEEVIQGLGKQAPLLDVTLPPKPPHPASRILGREPRHAIPGGIAKWWQK